ncbi:Predicted Zn-dependent peptidase [Cnuella takakiae]|uniref:Predicted Zn-dependent peptidase n=1 Tax=Cnuella takakiae TaxID=1302690 RepID=A0A1M4V6Y2_9BACT|nr:pitrilysin family protein [Cnuella takakiae]OLY92690.1 peptidase M16 [Cnuella takakiae]SHE64608.1 Predicted Zn-dependent peptidase [Cnuella takakiae]
MRKLILLALLGLSMGSQAQNKASDVQTFTLKNGMKFLVLEDFSIPNANMYLFYKVGSRNEHPGITGLSHFFEHMMFNGAKKHGPKQFDRVMEFNGGANNAYTTEDMTVYTDWFPASALETIFDLEADRIASLNIDSAMVESERGVVLSERSTGLENSPWRLLLENVQATAFQDGPYHWPVIGYEQDIKNWTKKDLEYYFRTYYAPNNAVVVVSGGVKTEDVKRLATKYLEPIAAQPAPKPVHLVESPQLGERRIVVQKEVATPYLSIAYRTPATRDSDYYALKVLESVLAAGNSSRLYASLVDQQQLATSVFVYFGESFDPNLFSINAVTNAGVQPETLEQAIYTQLEKLKREGITEAELQKIKNQKTVELYRQLETINGKSNNLGNYEAYFGDYRKLFEAPQEYNKLTTADIQRVANKYLRKSTRTVGVLQSNID